MGVSGGGQQGAGRPTGSFSGLTEAELRAWVEASCQAQGVPVFVSDAATVRAVQVLLTEPGAGLPSAGAKREHGMAAPGFLSGATPDVPEPG